MITAEHELRRSRHLGEERRKLHGAQPMPYSRETGLYSFAPARASRRAAARPAARVARAWSGARRGDGHPAEPLHRLAVRTSIGSGSAGHGVITTPATRRPAARAASIVSSVWLIVPRPVRAAITTGRPRSTREVADQVGGRERDHQAADALDDERVAALPPRRGRRRRAAPASISTPACSAARCGESGGPKRYGATSSGDWPQFATEASSSWSWPHSPGSSSRPGDRGLERGDASRLARRARRRSPPRGRTCRPRCRSR